jgi:hypothetical protein
MATYLLAVQTTQGRMLDGSSFRGAKQARSPVTAVVERLLDIISVSSLAAALVIVAAIALLRLRRDLALAALAVILGSNATSQLLKNYVLSRPDLGIYETTPATLNSLPSGHSTVAFSVAVGMVLVLPVALRPIAAAAGVAYASIAAVATLSAGWHRPSDSIAAFLVVGTWAAAAEAVVIARRSEPLENGAASLLTAVHRKTARRLAVAATYLLAFGGLIATVVVSTHLDPYGTAAQLLSYAAAATLICGTAAAVMAALIVPLTEIRTETTEHVGMSRWQTATHHAARSPTTG